MRKYFLVSFPIVLCLLVGYVSGNFTRSSITTWYPTLVKPFFNPPNWIFFPVWTLLYFLMGLAAGLILIEMELKTQLAKKALIFFGFQLVLNALWSYLFFSLHNPFLAAIEIVILWLFIYETMEKFKQINKNAGLLLLPYLAWVSFAVLLNSSIWWLNK